MRTSKRNNSKMESKTQTQHNRKKASRIRVSERNRERAKRKVKRARHTKLAKEASAATSAAVMADETSLPATTTTATIFSNSLYCKRQKREEKKSPMLKSKRGERDRVEHNIRSSRRVAECFCLLLTPSLGAVHRHRLSLFTSLTLFDEWVERLWQTVLKRDRQRRRKSRSGGLKRVCWEFCCTAIWWVFNW